MRKELATYYRIGGNVKDAENFESWLKTNIAALVAYPTERISHDSDLRGELGLDSSDLMFLQLQIEERIGAPLEYDENTRIYSFGDLLASIKQAVRQNS